MPKIIENLPQRLLEEARKQIAASGYAALTVRSVAKSCGVGVGTVYNYFPSKESLLAAYMLQDWHGCMDTVRAAAANATEAEPVLRCIWEQLRYYAGLHSAIFRDEAAAGSFAGSFSRYHALLRQELAEPLRRFCPDDFTAQFLSEALLTWTMDGKDFDEIFRIIRKLC